VDIQLFREYLGLAARLLAELQGAALL
jgi:hypothetical protein